MAELKTQRHDGSVEAFLEDVDFQVLRELVGDSVTRLRRTQES